MYDVNSRQILAAVIFASLLSLAIAAFPDADTSDVWVRQTDAVSYTTSAALKTKLVAFEVDVDTLDTNNDFDCLCVKAAASNAANILSAQYIVTGERYHNVSMIVD